MTGRFLNLIRVAVAAGVLWLATESCGRFGTSGPGQETPVSADAAAADQSSALYRLTPEQVANLATQALGVTLAAKSADGMASDQLRVTYNVALGGVDFNPTRVRDFSAKVQTVLIARSLAWRIASQLVSAENTLAKNGAPIVFTLCDIRKDRPALPTESSAAAQAAETRWATQIEELYWRLFSRTPTPAEASAIRTAFLAVYTGENKSMSRAWTTVVYVLLSTAEFWHS